MFFAKKIEIFIPTDDFDLDTLFDTIADQDHLAAIFCLSEHFERFPDRNLAGLYVVTMKVRNDTTKYKIKFQPTK